MQAEHGTSITVEVDGHGVGMDFLHVMTSSTSVSVVEPLANLECHKNLGQNIS